MRVRFMQRGGFSTEVSHNLMFGGHVQDTVEVFLGGETPHKKGKVQAVHPLFKNKSGNVKV